MSFVSICEVGPRDGLQIAKTRMTTDDKVQWIVSLAAAGIREIEVGSFVPQCGSAALREKYPFPATHLPKP